MIDPEVQASLRAAYNPDGSELRRLQMATLRVLEEVDRICRAREIPYWLAFGTLLGAVRHGGFIPWDDDVDIEMYAEDYERFAAAVREEGFSRPTLHLQCHATDPDYYMLHSKVVDTSVDVRDKYGVDRWYKYRGVFVDIIILRRTNAAYNSIFYFNQKIQEKLTIKGATSRLARLLAKVHYNVVFRGLVPPVRWLAAHTCKHYTLPPGTGRFRIYSKPWPRLRDMILPLKDAAFEGVKVCVPFDSDAYLTTEFGDYMRLPKDKHSHFAHS